MFTNVTNATGICYNDVNLYYNDTSNWLGFGSPQTTKGIWEKKSQMYVIPNVTSPILQLAILPYNGSEQLQSCCDDGVLLIDLTATFGAGNEPSKEWCDANLEYFDGTKTFYLKLS